MARPPVVDVGIPTYGHPHHLAETMESVLAQTFSDWRLTVSENGEGNDVVAGIVEPYLGDPRVSHVVVGENVGGVGNARRLIESATAKYVGIVHDDDRWEPGFLARRVSFLEAHPGCGLVFAPCDFIGPSGAFLYREEPRLRPGLQDRRAFLRELYRFNMICTPSVLVPRACYDAAGPYDDSLLFYDHEMWLRLAARFDVGFLPGADSSYRVHRSQTSQEARRRWGEHQIAVLDAAERILPADFPSRDRRRIRFLAHVRAGKDAFARREPGVALRSLGSAVRRHPLAPVDPVIAARAVGWASRRGVRRRVRRALTPPARPRPAARAEKAS
jgi:glycosyltransferase involved in cell wall biosynthesis